MSLFSLANRTALVTGASSGLGAAAAVAFGRCGAMVAVHYNRSKDGAETTAATVRTAGGEAVVLQADVRDTEAVASLVAATVEAFGSIDLRNMLVDQPSPEPISLRSQADLDQFLVDTHTTAFLVVRNGVLVHEWYAEDIDPDALHTSFSVAKSMLSTVVGMAISDGSIASLDDAITSYVPELLEKDPRFADITLRHLITMTSGLRYVEDMSPYGDPVNTYYATDLRRSAVNAVIVDEPGK